MNKVNEIQTTLSDYRKTRDDLRGRIANIDKRLESCPILERKNLNRRRYYLWTELYEVEGVVGEIERYLEAVKK